MLIKRWLLHGELATDLETEREVVDDMLQLMRKYNAEQILGPVLFESEDGLFYTCGVEAYLTRVSREYAEEQFGDLLADRGITL